MDNILWWYRTVSLWYGYIPIAYSDQLKDNVLVYSGLQPEEFLLAQGKSN